MSILKLLDKVTLKSKSPETLNISLILRKKIKKYNKEVYYLSRLKLELELTLRSLIFNKLMFFGIDSLELSLLLSQLFV